MERTGWFSCSHPELDRLHDNVVWGMRGNFLDVPTDCPQRDERLGWTGDAQVFAPTASFLYDCAGMLASWLRDVAAEQRDDGVVPLYVPYVELDFTPPGEPDGPVAAWGDAAVIVPWVLYERFGDRGLLAAQFDEHAGVGGRRGRARGRRCCGTRARSSATGWTRRRRPTSRGRPRPTRTSSPPRTWPARPSCVARARDVLGPRTRAERYGELAAACAHAFSAST
jgi:alpha-L-rhamnosidase